MRKYWADTTAAVIFYVYTAIVMYVSEYMCVCLNLFWGFYFNALIHLFINDTPALPVPTENIFQHHLHYPEASMHEKNCVRELIIKYSYVNEKKLNK